jgi:hypothetical protein
MDKRRIALAQKQLGVARLVAPQCTDKAGARVVNASSRRGNRGICADYRRLEAQSLVGRFVDHPAKRH